MVTLCACFGRRTARSKLVCLRAAIICKQQRLPLFQVAYYDVGVTNGKCSVTWSLWAASCNKEVFFSHQILCDFATLFVGYTIKQGLAFLELLLCWNHLYHHLVLVPIPISISTCFMFITLTQHEATSSLAMQFNIARQGDLMKRSHVYLYIYKIRIKNVCIIKTRPTLSFFFCSFNWPR